ILGDEGIISVFIVVDSSSGKIVGGPHIQARGSGIDDSAFGAVTPKIQDALDKSAQDGVMEPHQLQQMVRRVVGKWVSDTYRRRPMILPVVVEV
ncbi:RNase J family beta-CASP ribonuclease, partial [Streptomyces sp. SID7499]|nr:RNase J family beta-CASP ribonuclease [Streptomyces sp. SID7499]